MARYTGGWIKLHRKVLDKEWVADDAVMLGLWVKLLLWAHRKDSHSMLRGQLIPVKRGQVVTSADNLARKLKLDRKAVERRLARLEADQMVTSEVTTFGRIITIVNYEHYQRKIKPPGNETGEERAGDGQVTGSRRAQSGEEGRRGKKYKNHPKSLRDELKFEATAVLGLALGALNKGLRGEDAKRYIGERGWAAIAKRYSTLEGFGDAFVSKQRKSSTAIVEAQARDALAAVLGTLGQTH